MSEVNLPDMSPVTWDSGRDTPVFDRLLEDWARAAARARLDDAARELMGATR